MQCTFNFNDVPEPLCRYNNVNLTILDPFQRQIQGFPKGGGGGGRGMSRVWIFHTSTFCRVTNHVVHGQDPSGQHGGGQNTS